MGAFQGSRELCGVQQQVTEVLPDERIELARGDEARGTGRLAVRMRWLGLARADAYAAAQLTALGILGDLKRALGDLDRVTAWLRVFGMVNAAPGFNQTPAVINGCSDLILELYGPEAGVHARSAIGVAELPFDIPVEIEAEVEIAE
jgi:enamine deaminase RidA (YjgF/YER057c/UK114 family)